MSNPLLIPLVFLACLHELTVSVLLYVPGKETIGVVVLDAEQGGDLTSTSAIALVLTIVVLLCALPLVASRAQGGDEIREGDETLAPGDGPEATFDQIGLGRVDHHAGARLHQDPEDFDVVGLHAATPVGRTMPLCRNFDWMMSPSNGFMMYSSAPASRA